MQKSSCNTIQLLANSHENSIDRQTNYLSALYEGGHVTWHACLTSTIPLGHSAICSLFEFSINNPSSHGLPSFFLFTQKVVFYLVCPPSFSDSLESLCNFKLNFTPTHLSLIVYVSILLYLLHYHQLEHGPIWGVQKSGCNAIPLLANSHTNGIHPYSCDLEPQFLLIFPDNWQIFLGHFGSIWLWIICSWSCE